MLQSWYYDMKKRTVKAARACDQTNTFINRQDFVEF